MPLPGFRRTLKCFTEPQQAAVDGIRLVRLTATANIVTHDRRAVPN